MKNLEKNWWHLNFLQRTLGRWPLYYILHNLIAASSCTQKFCHISQKVNIVLAILQLCTFFALSKCILLESTKTLDQIRGVINRARHIRIKTHWHDCICHWCNYYILICGFSLERNLTCWAPSLEEIDATPSRFALGGGQPNCWWSLPALIEIETFWLAFLSLESRFFRHKKIRL